MREEMKRDIILSSIPKEYFQLKWTKEEIFKRKLKRRFKEVNKCSK